MDFKKRLAKAMEVRECSRAALAKELQVSVQAIGMVLSGDTRALTAENAAKAARFLRVDYFWLATGDGEMEPQQAWPFERITIERYTSLHAPERAYVEGKLVAAIEECELLTMSPAQQRRFEELTKQTRKSRQSVKKPA